MVNAYNDEEVKSLKNVKTVARSSIPKLSNITGTHNIYTLKLNDDQHFKLEAIIVPHGNEDSYKDTLPTDCGMCRQISIRSILKTYYTNSKD